MEVIVSVPSDYTNSLFGCQEIEMREIENPWIAQLYMRDWNLMDFIFSGRNVTGITISRK